MTAITTRTAERAPRNNASGRLTRLLHRLSALATAAAERLTSPYRDLPSDYRFPPF